MLLTIKVYLSRLSVHVAKFVNVLGTFKHNIKNIKFKSDFTINGASFQNIIISNHQIPLKYQSLYPACKEWR